MTTASVSTSRPIVRRWLIAISLTVVALAIITLLPALPHHLIAFTFLLAVAATTWWAGSIPALVPAAVGYVLSLALNDELALAEPPLSYIAYAFATVSILVMGELSRRLRKRRAERDLALEALAVVPQAAIILNRHGRIMHMNPAALGLTGHSETELYGKALNVLFKLPTQLAADLSDCDGSGTLEGVEGKVSVDYQLSILKDTKGITRGFAFIFSDSSDEKEEESKALLAAIVAASDDAIISKSLDGIIRSWNASAERLLGYSEAEMVGRSINNIIPPELQKEEATIIARIRAGQRLEHFETVRVTKDQQRVELSLTVSPIFDREGRVVGASKVARDISAQKKAERALKVSEERFRLMADSAPVLIWMAGTDGQAHWFNRRWLRFTGRSMEEETGIGWSVGLHPDEAQQVLQSYQQHCHSHQHYTMEHRLRRADGEYRWLLVNALPMQSDGEFNGYIGSCVDITDRKHAEESLRIEDRRKTEFIATLAHELRNPLAPIRNTLEILKAADHEPQLRERSYNIIERQLIHMVRLVDDLLNISRINQDKLALRTERVELSQLIEQAVETVQSFIDENGHRLRIRDASHSVTLQADPVRLTQVLSNLLSNACKFTPPGGDITLSVHQQNDDVFVSVKDTGIGLSPDDIQSIFGLFQQGETGKDRSTEGLGIGLTLAKRLVEMHGGSITVSSAGVGQGTTFTINLPVVASPAKLANKTAVFSTAQPQRILVVDDNRDNAETLAVLLGLEGHEIRMAYDGLQALDEAETFQPNVILLDLGLPKLDGIEVCRRLRKQPWGRTISIIALTGWGQEEDRQKSKDAGFDEHLVKPVSHERLLQELARHNERAHLSH